MVKATDRNKSRKRRQLRIRGKLRGTAERPRLNVYRSLNNIYAQIIDDDAEQTLIAASSLEEGIEDGNNMKGAQQVGALIAKKATDKGITEVVFDRSGYIYHGRVKALAEGAREGGLKF